MNYTHNKLHWLMALLIPLSGCSREDPVGYSVDIEPLLHTSCQQCHSHNNAHATEGGFSVDSYADVYQGGRSGPVIDHDNPTASVLVHIMAGRDERFQEDGDHFVTTNKHQRARIKEWVKRGLYND